MDSLFDSVYYEERLVFVTFSSRFSEDYRPSAPQNAKSRAAVATAAWRRG